MVRPERLPVAAGRHAGQQRARRLPQPNLRTIDIVAVKSIDLRGDARLEERLEVFNVFNRANFRNLSLIAFTGNADNEQPQTSFGRIRSTITAARQAQLGARIVF